MTAVVAASATQAGENSKAGSLGDLDNASVMEADAAAAALAVDVDNRLSAQEAACRLAQHGPNELRAAVWPTTCFVDHPMRDTDEPRGGPVHPPSHLQEPGA